MSQIFIEIEFLISHNTHYSDNKNLRVIVETNAQMCFSIDIAKRNPTFPRQSLISCNSKLLIPT